MLQRMAIREGGYQTYFAGLPPHPASTGSSHDVHFSPSWGLNNSSTFWYWEPKSLEMVWRFIWRNADPKWLHRLKVALSPVHLCTTLELEPRLSHGRVARRRKIKVQKKNSVGVGRVLDHILHCMFARYFNISTKDLCLQKKGIWWWWEKQFKFMFSIKVWVQTAAAITTTTKKSHLAMLPRAYVS